jgi:hypothetical protein
VAQVTGGSDFDFVWDDKRNAALRVLREAADLWATRGRQIVQVDRVVAAFMQVLAWPQRGLWWSPRWPLRFLNEAATMPPSPIQSCLTLAPARKPEECAAVVKALEEAISEAADLWALGDPEKPVTLRYLEVLLGILWNRRVAPRPPGSLDAEHV